MPDPILPPPQGKLFRLSFCLLLLGIAPEPGAAQVLPFESYTVKNGLLSNDIRVITQDADGYLWVGTRDGVSRFDGRQFINYTTADGLPAGTVGEVVEDRAAGGRSFWILGSRGVLLRWSPGHSEPVAYDSTLPWLHRITALCQDHTGMLWAGTEDTLVQIVASRIRPVASGVSTRYPDIIKEQGDSVLWITSRSGLARYEEATGKFLQVPLGRFQGMHLNALEFAEGGIVWAGVDSGYILRIEHSALVGWRKTEPFVFLVQDHQRRLWFGSYLGLYRLSQPLVADSRVERLTVAQGLRENTLKEAFVDREGSLWLGGISQGLVKLTDEHTVRFPFQDINPPYQFAIGAADRNNHLWVVARSGLWELWYGDDAVWHQAAHRKLEGRGKARPFPVFDIDMGNSSEVRPSSLFCQCDSTLWVVFSNGQIVSYVIRSSGHAPSRLEVRKVLRAGVEVPHEFPKSMIVDHRGLIWYSAGTGIFLLDPGRRLPLLRRFQDAPPGLGRNYARVLFEDRSGNIWAGFFTGGARRLAADSLLDGEFRRVRTPDGFSSDGITAIAQDSLGRVWIGTEERGAVLCSVGAPERINAPRGLASNTVLSVAVEPRGRIWIGSPLGISYMERPERGGAIQPSRFLGEYAVQAGVMPDGTVWFAGRSGVILYDGKSDTLGTPAPKVSITAFQVNGRSRELSPTQSLSYNENTCAIGFVAPTFRDPAMVRYQYRLRENDTAWSAAQEQNGVTFASLPPGEYTFEVRAVVVGTGAASEPTAVRISIVPPFWKRSWFLVLGWLTLATVMGGTVRYFEKRKVLARLRTLEVQQALDHERLRISQDMHDEVGSALTEIRILSELAQKKPEGTGTYIQEISERAAEVIDSVSEIVWAMNPRNDTLDNLIAHVRRHAVKYLSVAGIRCSVCIPDGIPASHIAGEDRRNVFLVVKEVLHNTVKHSGATDLELAVGLSERAVEISLRDNGKGYNAEGRSRFGNGLDNMQSRLGRTKGECVVYSDPLQGTRVSIRFPLPSAEDRKIT